MLAAVRLGCNFDYDKLQDLAEQHRTLRLIMGIGDWQEREDFDWRRIRDNLCLLRPRNAGEDQSPDRGGGTPTGAAGDRGGAWRYVRGGDQHSLSHGVESDRGWLAARS